MKTIGGCFDVGRKVDIYRSWRGRLKGLRIRKFLRSAWVPANLIESVTPLLQASKSAQNIAGTAGLGLVLLGPLGALIGAASGACIPGQEITVVVSLKDGRQFTAAVNENEYKYLLAI